MRRVTAPILPCLGLALCLVAGGCNTAWDSTATAAAVNVAAIPIFGRSLPDIAVSAVTGRDCSIVRLDRGQTYCAPVERPSGSPPFCSRTIGTVDCWTDPEALINRPRELADQPSTLTPDQERNRAARWPKSLFGL